LGCGPLSWVGLLRGSKAGLVGYFILSILSDIRIRTDVLGTKTAPMALLQAVYEEVADGRLCSS
jgi:hypothetical protein